MPDIVVLASGSGTNFEAIVEASHKQFKDINVRMLITDNPQAYATYRAERLNIPYTVLPRKGRFRVLDDICQTISPELIVLAGFMRIIPEWFVDKYYGKVVNLHPSLLPSFPGKEGIKQAYQYGVKVTGITIHFVDKGIDTGPIIFQYPILVSSSWSLEELEEHIHGIEHRFYPAVISALLHCKYEIRGRKVIFTDNRGDACEIFELVRGDTVSEIWGKSP